MMSEPVSTVCSRSSKLSLTLSLDTSSSYSGTPATSLDPQDHRWSDVVPPKSALTFAAMWDPEKGMVTFTGAHLLESRDEQGCPESVATDEYAHDDDLSRILPVDLYGTSATEDTSTLSAFKDVFRTFVHRSLVKGSNRNTRQYRNSTVASSTLDGLDLYSREMVPGRQSRLLSRINQLEDRYIRQMETPLSPVPFTVVRTRETLETPRDLCRKFDPISHFSTTTTSTSNYIHVPPFKDDSSFALSAWSSVEVPSSSDLLYASETDSPRRLKKRRPSVRADHSPRHDQSTNPSKNATRIRSPPASPPVCSSSPPPSSFRSPRETFSAPVSPSFETPKLAKFVRRIKSLPRCGRSASDDVWVVVDVTPRITQRIVPSPPSGGA